MLVTTLRDPFLSKSGASTNPGAIHAVVLADGHSLEWPSCLHTADGFALAWGAFPVPVGC